MRVCLLNLVVAFPLDVSPQVTKSNPHPTRGQAVRLPWYVTSAAMHRAMLKPKTQFYRHERLSLNLFDAASQLRQWQSEGIDSIDVYAPEDGGNSFGGLDAKDRFALDPGIGSIDDFRRLVKQAHAMHMSVITSQNLGYAALEGPQFIKAEQDVRAGLSSGESQFFFWSESEGAPPPGTGNSYFLIRPPLPGYDAHKNEFWQWSDKAGQYYWTRWPGKDADGKTTHLPQYNWSAPAWPQEASRVVDFWMGTGLDGMVVDAVNWYIGFDWGKSASLIASMRRHPGDKFMLAEGGGAFHTDDPIGWILDGGWTALYDYGIDIPWEKGNRPLVQSIDSENPAIYEQALRNFHDRVVAAGGVLVAYVIDMKDPGKQRLAEELIATSGDLPCYCGPDDATNHPAPGVTPILKLKAQNPALYQNSLRRRIVTDRDENVYATLRYAADHSEQILVIFNFSSHPIKVQVDARAIAGAKYWDLESESPVVLKGGTLDLELEGYGHRLFRVNP
jgi:hypothetical protein